MVLTLVLLNQRQAPFDVLCPIGAILVVSYVCLVERQPAPAVLQWLGRISYSVYLIHVMVITALPALPNSLLRVMIWLLVLLSLATVTERLIGRPGIALGRRLTRRTSLSEAVAPTTILTVV